MYFVSKKLNQYGVVPLATNPDALGNLMGTLCTFMRVLLANNESNGLEACELDQEVGTRIEKYMPPSFQRNSQESALLVLSLRLINPSKPPSPIN